MKAFHAISLSLALAAMSTSAPAAYAGTPEEAVTAVICNYRPGTTGFGPVKAEKVIIDKARKAITIELNGNASYIPLTAQKLEALKAECLAALGPQYTKYKISLKSDGHTLDQLALFAAKKNLAPKEKASFITRNDAPEAPQGLDGANIAMWQSHGWYFEPKLNRWEWQRARIFQTVEDLYTQSYVVPFLMPMLENAGAYVMSPRERDINTCEIIIDNDASDNTKGSFEAPANCTSVAGFGYKKAELHNGDNPFADGTAAVLKATPDNSEKFSWKAAIPKDGNYAVYISYKSLPNSTDKAEYKVNASDGTHKFTVNQKMGGGTWIYLGHFPFKASDKNTPIVELSAKGKKGSVVTADAVKIGGGMGNVARIVKEPLDSIDYQYVLSGYPRFTEAAKYFLQWAGAPDSVYTPTNNVNDYSDDYRSRGLWVNWITGGSSMLPDREGLGIPVDLSFAFHTDAGTTTNDSIIGTLGIYSTAGKTLGNGSDRMASRDLTDLIMTNIVDDVRANFEPNWTRRGMWDKSYFEARSPEVPAMLLEFLSHQNFADMTYGLDPAFRFLVSRAIYKGMLKYIAQRDGRPYVVQPLPVRAFAITADSEAGKYRLSWAERPDSSEPSAKPSYYIVQERVADGAFRNIARTENPEYTVKVSDNKIHSYRIIAANDGGTAFPSEILALCDMPGSKATVTIVNGFTRVSAPDRFNSGEIAGFYDTRDHGVPYLYDISFIGSQFEFRRDIPWMDDDAAGFGASRANYEDKVVAGNTFDYVYTHGEAVRAAGYSFVSSSAEAFSAATDTPRIVDLILGKQKEILQGRGAYGPRFKAFPSELQTRMAALASKGTAFFVSGSYVATDIWDNPNSNQETAKADKEFAREVLGFNWRVGQASVTGEAYQVATRFKDFTKGEYKFHNELNPDFYAVESPDSFYPADNSKCATFMRYSENNLIAGTVYDSGEHRAVVIGFPFETIKGLGGRQSLMKQVLDFFADPSPLRNKSK